MKKTETVREHKKSPFLLIQLMHQKILVADNDVL